MILSKRHKAELNYILYEVTEQCNLNCSFCYNHWKRAGYYEIRKENSYHNSLKTLKRFFNLADVKHVTFTGGEPLLADRVSELILYCRMKGATVSIISNGNTGDTEEYAMYIKLGVQLFELPVHSAEPASHDRMTGVIGSWRKSVDSIRSVAEMGGTVVPVVVVTKLNFKEVGRTLEFIHSMGFSRIMLNRYNIGGKSVGSPEKVSATREELNDAFRQANEIAGKLNLTVSSNVCTPHCVIDPSLYRNIHFGNCSTDIRHRPLTLTNSGELRFCNHSPNVLGNIFNDSIDTIFKNGLMFGSFTKRPEYCTGCTKYETCLGGCRAAAEQAGGNFDDIDPVILLDNIKANLKTA
jgi:radical SAM protein with 4Fe4S-binding SPASM domain